MKPTRGRCTFSAWSLNPPALAGGCWFRGASGSLLNPTWLRSRQREIGGGHAPRLQPRCELRPLGTKQCSWGVPRFPAYPVGARSLCGYRHGCSAVGSMDALQARFHPPCRGRVFAGDVGNNLAQVVAGRCKPEDGQHQRALVLSSIWTPDGRKNVGIVDYH